jgi:putative membrane protein
MKTYRCLCVLMMKLSSFRGLRVNFHFQWFPIVVLFGTSLGLSASAHAQDGTNIFGAERLAAVDPLTAADRAFLAEARESIRQQRRLGELGQSQARNTEVRRHAQKIVSDYRTMLEAIDGLVRKKGVALVESPEIPSSAYQEVSGKAGPEFERAFVLAMVDLHENTLSLFEHTAADARDPDVRQLAAAQLPVLREHRNGITVLRKLYE